MWSLISSHAPPSIKLDFYVLWAHSLALFTSCNHHQRQKTPIKTWTLNRKLCAQKKRENLCILFTEAYCRLISTPHRLSCARNDTTWDSWVMKIIIKLDDMLECLPHTSHSPNIISQMRNKKNLKSVKWIFKKFFNFKTRLQHSREDEHSLYSDDDEII